ncbi:MAG: hypothetical protein KGD63_04875 [Candidatus Lokiarchaeota archaeon]|nr:hypothetical protein [Candidatus Lokiarchaeota archaeon]
MRKELIQVLIALYITFWITVFTLFFPAYPIVTEATGYGITEHNFLEIIGFFKINGESPT